MNFLYICNMKNVNIIHGDYTPSTEFKRLVDEFDGIYILGDQCVTMDYDGLKIDVMYTAEVTGEL